MPTCCSSTARQGPARRARQYRGRLTDVAVVAVSTGEIASPAEQLSARARQPVQLPGHPACTHPADSRRGAPFRDSASRGAERPARLDAERFAGSAEAPQKLLRASALRGCSPQAWTTSPVEGEPRVARRSIHCIEVG